MGAFKTTQSTWETQRAHMMGLKVYLLIALAVSCHGLPRTTEEVVPERQTMLQQHTAAFTSMSPTAFISAMTSSGGTEATCRSFADETIKTIDKTVTATQGEVDAIETGDGCAALGQDAVKAEEAKVAAAKLVVQNAKADVASKTDAKDTAASAPYTVTFDLMSTSQPNCLDVSGESSYLAVKNARDTATAAHAADWKSAHEVICALDKTATCTVPSCPTVTQPTLAPGVATADSEHCTPEPTNAPTPPPCNPYRCSAKGSNHPFCDRATGYCCQNHPGGSTGKYGYCVTKTRFNMPCNADANEGPNGRC